MSRRCKLWILLALFAAAPPLAADETLYPSANLALPWQDNGFTARALALGGAYTSVADASSALLWNPGGLAFLDQVELGLHHSSGLDGIYQELGLLGVPLDGWGGLAAAVAYVNDGGFLGRDAQGNPSQFYSAGDLAASLGWGWHWGPRLGLGLSAGYTQQTLADTTYQAYAAGLGLLWKALPSLWLGADVANLGNAVAGSPQSASLNLGASLHIHAGDDNQLVAALGFKDQLSGTQILEAGLEDELLHTLALRAGYQHDFTQNQLDGMAGLTAGLGLAVGGFSLDYAYLPFGQLGSTQTLSLTYHFGTSSPSAPRPEPRRAKAAARTSKAPGQSLDLPGQIRLYHERVVRNPSDATAWWTLGNLFYRTKDYAKANYCFKKTIKLLPGNPQINAWYRKFLRNHPDLK